MWRQASPTLAAVSLDLPEYDASVIHHSRIPASDVRRVSDELLEMTRAQRAALAVIGRDRPGIIAEVTGVVADLGGNLEDSSMTLLRGHFTWTLIADLAANPTELADRLAHLSADDLVVSVLPVGPEEGAADRAGYLLSVHGADRPASWPR